MKKFFSKLKKSLGKIGPGFITGAADDDPSGITTYSIAGAQYGYKLFSFEKFGTNDPQHVVGLYLR